MSRLFDLYLLVGCLFTRYFWGEGWGVVGWGIGTSDYDEVVC